MHVLSHVIVTLTTNSPRVASEEGNSPRHGEEGGVPGTLTIRMLSLIKPEWLLGMYEAVFQRLRIFFLGLERFCLLSK